MGEQDGLEVDKVCVWGASGRLRGRCKGYVTRRPVGVVRGRWHSTQKSSMTVQEAIKHPAPFHLEPLRN
jgi:hypothetical protein